MILGCMPTPEPVVPAAEWGGGCEFAGYGSHACRAREVGSVPAELHRQKVTEGLASRESQKNA